MLWMSFMAAPMATGSVWTDAWLAAFALSQGIRLVTFDAGMQRWAMLDPEILRP
jgi:predicted nucleic acid-binding protein